jgi:hypothetical protein
LNVQIILFRRMPRVCEKITSYQRQGERILGV